MLGNFISRIFSVVIILFLSITNSWGQKEDSTSTRRDSGSVPTQKKAPPQKPLTEAELQKLAATKSKPPTGASFYMAAISDQPGNFTVLVTDENGRSASDQISSRELPILEAILDAAKNFASNNEGVGQNRAQTTRFSDDQLPRYIVDVDKVGNQSRFILKLNSLMGKVALDAGSIKRSSREPAAMFYDILDIVKKALAGEQNPQTTIKFKTVTQEPERPPQ